MDSVCKANELGFVIEDRGGGVIFIIIPTLDQFRIHQSLVREIKPSAVVILDSKGDTKFEGIETLSAIYRLTVGFSGSLATVNGIQAMPDLEMLELLNCEALIDIGAINGLQKLISLTISKGHRIANLNAISGNTTLQTVSLIECPSITDLNAVKTLTSLKSLYIENCNGISPELIESLKITMPKLHIYYE